MLNVILMISKNAFYALPWETDLCLEPKQKLDF